MHSSKKRSRAALLILSSSFLFAISLACGGGDEDETSSEGAGEPASVLSRVESLAPATEVSDFEPYERILQDQQAAAAGLPTFGPPSPPLPPTLTDVLMHDFRLTAHVDLHLGVLDQSVTEAQMAQIIAFYVATGEGSIRGYRPHAHKRFIVGLSEAERAQLATESADYVHEHGFLGPPIQG